MLSSSNWQYISQQIEQTTNQPFPIEEIQAISGGSINSAYLLSGNNQRYFIKLNHASLLSMFRAEFSGLAEITQAQCIKTPQAILTGTVADTAFLVLEYISLYSTDSQSDTKLGSQLACLHKTPQPFFGWDIENTIGSTPQLNQSNTCWTSFWQTSRLNYQLSLAKKNSANSKLIDTTTKLLQAVPLFFTHYTPQASLLHGDLWSGNMAKTQQGEPIVFDPACYYGDRETDIAMTELFGGFSPYFYAAYNEAYPLDPGYSTRKKLYNLYHILNHFNLFGPSYQQQAQNMINSLLSEIH